jgi:hypothetical protein
MFFQLSAVFQGNLTQAITSFQRAVAVKPTFTAAVYNLELGYEKALGELNTAIGPRPDSPEFHLELSRILQKLDRLQG